MVGKLLSFFLCLSLLLPLWPREALAASWPGLTLRAEAGIVVDADTGTIIFEKNGTEKLYPASITKVMTALVVLDHAALTDQVTFSHDAVYNVDKGSSNAQIDEGDVLSVEDCLHALLLKSANEAANALAEHIAGSREAFAELMNEKAAALGCTGSHFVNPSGLPSEDHYTTARDMALIGQAAFQSAEFLEIESHLSYTLPSMRRVPDGLTIYQEHKMLLRNSPYHDDRAVAGKTGYTIAAGNTLVTLAESEGRRMVAVVLGDKNPAHYTDTKALLDSGFTESELLAIPESFYEYEGMLQRMRDDGVVGEETAVDALQVSEEGFATVPLGTEASALSYQLRYTLPAGAPEQAVAEIQFLLQDKVVGSSFLEREQTITVLPEEETETEAAAEPRREIFSVNGVLIVALAGIALLAGAIFLFLRGRWEEKKRMERMKERRRKRLEELSLSEDDFHDLLEKRRKK